jgi:hypothetical protein
VLKSGQIIQGVAKNYDNYSVQILDRAGKLHLLSRDEIGRLDILDVSMMPAVTDPGQARDLFAFLSRQSTRPANGESR